MGGDPAGAASVPGPRKRGTGGTLVVVGKWSEGSGASRQRPLIAKNAMNGAQLLRLSAILVTGPPALQFNSDDLKRNEMADIEIFLRGIVASVYREYGILGVVAVALAVFLVVIALGFLKIAWIRRNELKAWIVGKCKDNPRVAFSTAAFAGLIVFSFLFLPSSPFIVALWVTAGVALLIKSIRSRLIAARKLRIYLLGMLACVALTLGGMCHDVVFPPTARCNDGTYSSSNHHSGTCSWHGGVDEWNPDPWWQTIFR